MKFGLVLSASAQVTVTQLGQEVRTQASARNGQTQPLPGTLSPGEWVVDVPAAVPTAVALNRKGVAHYRSSGGLVRVEDSAMIINPENPPPPPSFSPVAPSWMNL